MNFIDIAKKLQEYYPDGNKKGTVLLWKDTIQEIAQQLEILAKCGFYSTEEEAIDAIVEYISTFRDYKNMEILRYFIAKEQSTGNTKSIFMDIIKTFRKNENINKL